MNIPQSTLDALVAHSHDASESIRALNHLTISRAFSGLPAPETHRVLGNLSSTLQGIEELVEHLDRGLENAHKLDEMYDAEGGDPAEAVATARTRLTDAIRNLAQAQAAVGAASQALVWVGDRREG